MKKIKEKNNKWGYMLTGGGIGFLIGMLFIFLDETLPEFFAFYLPFPILYLINLFGECSDIGCAFLYMFSLIITYIIMGIIIAYLVYKIKKR